MSLKEDLVVRAAEGYRRFFEALEGLNEADLDEVWLGTWSIKDIVAHIVGWQREMIPALERLARGERPIPDGASYGAVDDWNARFVAARRQAEVTDVLLQLDRSHQDFMRAATAVPESRFEPGRSAPRIVDLNTVYHYQEHGDQIRAWRASRGV
jgi:hypothetical protein